MGWIWKDDESDGLTSSAGDIREYHQSPKPSSAGCSTRKVVQSRCRTEEVEPGKFIRKCEKTEEILRDCIGRPVEVVESNKEYTEDDVTDQVVKGSFSMGSEQGILDFPGLRSDIDAIEQNFFHGLGRFFEAADEIKNDFFNAFGMPHVFDGESTSRKRGVPFENQPQREAFPKPNDPDSGHIDLSELSRDV
ncbi:fra a 1-associated protein [Ziziphus jujuba]|uniref:Uncharacterized protein LOC107408402 n=1 Tax=Ziziphus jujuba TaxID=326968 RepID=A0A6P3Z2Y4_ZIZJJ|nr:fra a 1-associated protein [Ziziphus jujuba]